MDQRFQLTRLRRIIVMLVILVVSTEVSLRLIVGLGDPPRYRADPEIEYLMVPGEYSRFGNRYFINSAHMRSDEFSREVDESSEVKLLVLGDSVVNGGSLTDQSKLATELIPALALRSGLGYVRAFNVSAGSWGPANLLAYVRRFGTFGCSKAIVFVNTDDYRDTPTFSPLGPEQPTSKPMSALLDLLQNYGMRMFTRPRSTIDPSDGVTTVREFSQLLDELQTRGVQCAVAFHPKRSELEVGSTDDSVWFEAIARSKGVQICSTGPLLLASVRQGLNPYRDDIHPNDLGQSVLAQAIIDCIGSAPCQ
jgi:hypothetical protein